MTKVTFNVLANKLEASKNWTMENLKSTFAEMQAILSDNMADIQRLRLKFYPICADHYETNKVELKKVYTKYTFISEILGVEEAQIKQYNKLDLITQQFPEVDISEPMREIVAKFEPVVIDGKISKVDNKTVYQPREIVEKTELSTSEKISAKKVEIVKLENRIKKLKSEISELSSSETK